VKIGKISVSLICLLLLQGFAFSQQDILQTFDEGVLNWTNLTIYVTGKGRPDPELSPAQYRLSALISARKDATESILEILKNINLTSELRVGQLIEKSEAIKAQIEKIIDDLQIMGKPRHMLDGTVEIDVEFHLFDEFLNVVLPQNGDKLAEFISDESSGEDNALENQVYSYTGLIVDCRGLQVDFALAPKVLDEQGQEVYGPGWVNHKIALTAGIVQYVRDEDKAFARVGEVPIKIKGLHITGTGRCDVIIANADAVRLLNKDNLNFLNMCKVAFLVE